MNINNPKKYEEYGKCDYCGLTGKLHIYKGKYYDLFCLDRKKDEEGAKKLDKIDDYVKDKFTEMTTVPDLPLFPLTDYTTAEIQASNTYLNLVAEYTRQRIYLADGETYASKALVMLQDKMKKNNEFTNE